MIKVGTPSDLRVTVGVAALGAPSFHSLVMSPCGSSPPASFRHASTKDHHVAVVPDHIENVVIPEQAGHLLSPFLPLDTQPFQPIMPDLSPLSSTRRLPRYCSKSGVTDTLPGRKGLLLTRSEEADELSTSRYPSFSP